MRYNLINRWDNSLAFALLFLSMTINAQFNIKVGYIAQYAPLKELNSQFDIFNKRADVTSKYRAFHFMHGLELGARYMLSPTLAAELSAGNLFSSNNKSTVLVSNVAKNDEWRISQRIYNLGLESYLKSFSFGASVGYNKWSYSKDITGADKKQTVFSDNFFAAKISIGFTAKSDFTSMALKPYYAFPITGTKSISPIGDILSPGTNNANVFEKYQTFGLSVLFYNGPQN